MKYTMVLRMNAITAQRVGAFVWNDTCQSVFMFRRLNLVLWPTGFRLGEIVRHASGEVMYLTFESLTWCINGVRHTEPTVSQLAALVPAQDYAMLAPPRSKPDQWGKAAAALRDLELRRNANFAATPRGELPLFHDALGRPFTHAFLAGMLRDALTHCFGPKVATLWKRS
ncbi:hypothetical protein AB1Y20_002891 [Prymnesium parvum]|uniref:Uncharacterized protein n=1 Tax=Prymnesium parvum TaxID=97485 RepID=A0AB34JC72_PRYPA